MPEPSMQTSLPPELPSDVIFVYAGTRRGRPLDGIHFRLGMARSIAEGRMQSRGGIRPAPPPHAGHFSNAGGSLDPPARMRGRLDRRPLGSRPAACQQTAKDFAVYPFYGLGC